MKTSIDINTCFQHTNIGLATIIYHILSNQNKVTIEELFDIFLKEILFIPNLQNIMFDDFYEGLLLLYSIDKIQLINGKIMR